MVPNEDNNGLDRVRFELRSAGAKPGTENPLRNGIHTRGYLPHVKHEGASYFVTFRLNDSLPKEKLLQFQRERSELLRQMHLDSKIPETENHHADFEESANLEYYREVERYLDKGVGACHLRRPEIAEIVATALRHFAEKRYILRAWVVMPNHVHAVLWPMPNFLLSDILKNWKGYTANEANKILDRVGQPFWQRESFDHWIRDDEEKQRFCRYILNNPVKSKLCATPEEWRWSSAWPGW